MKGDRFTRLKHVPNVLVASASQNYICGDYAVNKALTEASRVLRLLELGRLVETRPLRKVCMGAAFGLWKAAGKKAVLGQIDEVLAKLHPFETVCPQSPAPSDESIIVAAFSPVSKRESDAILRLLDCKLANIARLLEAWRQREAVTTVSQSTQTASDQSFTESKGDFLKSESLVLQDGETRLEDRKLESLLAIDESYDAEHSSKFAAIFEVTESEFLQSLPETDPAALAHKLKLLEKHLIDRENRLIQITKTTHQELQLLIKEREQIAQERLLYSELEAIRTQLKQEAEQLEARSRALDDKAAEVECQLASLHVPSPADSDALAATPRRNEEGLNRALAQWLQHTLLSKPHSQRNSKLLSFCLWKSASRTGPRCSVSSCAERLWERSQSELELSGRRPLRWLPRNRRALELELMESKRKREFITVANILLKAVTRSAKRRVKARVTHYWNRYRLNTLRSSLSRHHRSLTIQPCPSAAARLGAIFLSRLQLSTSLAHWRRWSAMYENQLLRTQLTLFDLNLQGLQLQRQAHRATITIAQSQIDSKLAQLSTLLEHYLM